MSEAQSAVSSQKGVKDYEQNSKPCETSREGTDETTPIQNVVTPAGGRDTIEQLDPWQYHRSSPPSTVPLAILPQLVKMANSQDESEVIHGVLLIRKLLSVEGVENLPSQAVVDTGVCGRLVECMQHTDKELQFNASWALANIEASNTRYTRYVIDLGAVPAWVQHLSNPCINCTEQALWALGNIAGADASHRDYILKMGAFLPALSIIQNCPYQNLPVMRCAVWAVANMCRMKPYPALDDVAPAVPLLIQTVQHSDLEIILDSLLALSCICDGSQDRVQLVIDNGVVPLIMNILNTPNDQFHEFAIRILGSICSACEEQAQVAINAGCLQNIAQFLDPSRSPVLQKETAWLLSNVCVQNVDHIQSVIEAGLLPVVVSTVGTLHPVVKKEAIWVCANVAACGTTEQVESLVEAGVLEVLFEVLATCNDEKSLSVALEAVLDIVACGAELMCTDIESKNIFAERIRKFGGNVAIKNLLGHCNHEIYLRAEEINEHFQGTDSDANENLSALDTSTHTS